MSKGDVEIESLLQRRERDCQGPSSASSFATNANSNPLWLGGTPPFINQNPWLLSYGVPANLTTATTTVLRLLPMAGIIMRLLTAAARAAASRPGWIAKNEGCL